MSLNRRQFLTGRLAGGNGVVRPPWALPELEFTGKCTQCGECIKVCPEKIILKGEGGYPEVSFNSSGCTFCGKCVVVCDDMALYRKRGASPWSLRAAVADTCLSIQGVTCRVCGDTCEAGAITFQVQSPEVIQPIIDDAACTGCGFCVNPCPVQAVTIYRGEGESR